MINNQNVKEFVGRYYSKSNIQKQTLDFFGQGFYNGRNYFFEMSNKSKLRAQIKSNAYYIFWGVATGAVLAGQVYIGLGYRAMTQSVNDLAEVFTLIRESNELKSGRYPNLY